MKRRLFTILTALSLLLCAAAIAVWIRSYYVADSIGWIHTDVIERETPGEHFGVVDELIHTVTTYTLISGRGGIAASRDNFDTRADRPGDRMFYLDRYSSGPFYYQRQSAQHPGRVLDGTGPTWRCLGFEFTSPEDGINEGFEIVFPIWLCVLLIALLPACRAIAFFLRRRAQPGKCSRCGYDLRATPGRCPECGAVPIGAKP